jgi:hypothetical protein
VRIAGSECRDQAAADALIAQSANNLTSVSPRDVDDLFADAKRVDGHSDRDEILKRMLTARHARLQ